MIQMIGAGDEAPLAKGEPDWVLTDATTGRPKSVPEAMKAMFEVNAEDRPA